MGQIQGATAMRRAMLLNALGASLGALLLGALPVPAQAAQKAGIAAAVVGKVAVTPEAGDGAQSATSGMDMFLGDHVVSAAESRLQMLLLDETVFSIGPNSNLVIDEFIYDPTSGQGKVAATFTKGLVRYVSGRVGKSQPGNVSIKLPVGTMGIRGTAVMLVDYAHAKELLPDMREGDTAAVLLGPGPQNNVNSGSGGFEIVSEFGSTSVDRSGFGVLLRPNQGPGQVFRTPPGLIALLQTQLTAAAGPGVQGIGSAIANASKAAGQTAAEGAQKAAEQSALNQQAASLNSGINEASEQLNRQPDTGSPKPPTPLPEPIPEPVNQTINSALNQGVGRLPSGVALPFAVQATWNRPLAAGSYFDLDLHLTGPNANGVGRFHVYFDNPGSYFTAPFALLDADSFGAQGSEVIGIFKLNPGSDYLASVFNFGDPRTAGTSLSDAGTNLIVSLIKNGQISRGPNGSAIVSLPADVITQVSPISGSAGNTFQAFSFNSAGIPTTVQSTINSTSPADVQ